jgi:hypothetical protein
LQFGFSILAIRSWSEWTKYQGAPIHENVEFLRLDRTHADALLDPSATYEELQERMKAWADYKDRLGFGKCRNEELNKIRAERQGQ